MTLSQVLNKEATLSSISSRLFLTVCIYTLILLVCFSASLYYFQKTNYVEAHKKSYSTILNLLSENLKAAISFNDILAADKILEASLEHHQIESLTIIKNNSIWSQAGSKDFSPQYLATHGIEFNSYKFIAQKEITMHRQSLGQIILIANASSWTQIEQKIILIISIIGIFSLIILKLVHHKLNALLSIRLKNITKALSQANPSVQQAPATIEKQANDEIGHLVEIINVLIESYTNKQNEMSESLKTISSELKKSKQLEREVRQKHLSSEISSKSKSQFIANLSEELKQSTARIYGYIDLISEHMVENPQVKQETRETVQNAKDSTHYLLTLISDILDLSLAESGSLALNLSNCNLIDLLSQTISIVEPLLAKNQNKITLHGDLYTIKLHTDAIKLRQVLTNIIANAAHFTDNGQITVSAYQFEDNNVAWLKILIKDTGLGIERQQLSGLFSAYLQEVHSTDKQRKGGFGLALSKTFIEMMGGIITVASEPAQGTIFELNIPVELKPLPEIRSNTPSDKVIEEKPDKSRNKLLLFVSNDQSTINRVMLNWSGNQIHIQQSESISIARKQLQRYSYDVLVIDSYYGTDCWNFVAEMKSDIKTYDIPIIVLGNQIEFEKAIILGADEILLKPVNIGKLNSAIRNSIQMAHA
jgi:signal transduction histidine kinase